MTLKVQALTRLALHYHRPDMSQAMAEQLLVDMLTDLERFSSADVERACMRWRTSAERFFPTSGQLIEMIQGASFSSPPRRLQLFKGYPEPEQQATKSVAQVLREHGHDKAADGYEAWKRRNAT